MKAETFLALAAGTLACTPTPAPTTEQITSSPVEQPTAAAPVPDRWIDFQIASDDSFSLGCAVEHGGRLWCWGQDPTLQAGLRPSLTPSAHTGRYRSSPPTPVQDVHDARAVALSSTHVCRLDGAGRVHCVSDDRGSWWAVEGVEDAVDVFVAEFRGCALEADGELRCWEDQGPSEVVHRNVVAADVVLSGGCALERSGLLACWKQAVQHGQRIESPRRVTPTPGIVNLEVVSDKYSDAAYVLDDRGRLRRYRFNTFNETGEWETIGDVVGAVEVAVARDHVCVRKNDGTAVCRGRNSHGQLGIGTSVRSERFVEIEARDVLGLSLGDLQTCVRTRTGIACSGWDPSEPEQLQQHTLPDRVAVSLAAHGATTCSVDGDGSMWCWGSELLQRFPHAPNFGVDAATTPVMVATGVGSLRGVWARESQVAWVGADGQLRPAAWADEPVGKLTPLDKINPSATIVQFDADYVACAIESTPNANILTCGLEPEHRSTVDGIRDPLAVAVAFRTICAIDKRRRVAWGVHPDLYDEMDFSLTRVPKVERAQAIAASHRSACALIDDGRVRCWTDDTEGPVGDVGLRDITVIVGGYDQYCSLDRAGAIACWEPNDDSVWPLDTPTIQAPLVELVAGAFHWCARDREGRVTCWGDERHGQLGRIPPTIALAPKPLDFAPSDLVPAAAETNAPADR